MILHFPLTFLAGHRKFYHLEMYGRKQIHLTEIIRNTSPLLVARWNAVSWLIHLQTQAFSQPTDTQLQLYQLFFSPRMLLSCGLVLVGNIKRVKRLWIKKQDKLPPQSKGEWTYITSCNVLVFSFLLLAVRGIVCGVSVLLSTAETGWWGYRRALELEREAELRDDQSFNLVIF